MSVNDAPLPSSSALAMAKKRKTQSVQANETADQSAAGTSCSSVCGMADLPSSPARRFSFKR